MPGFKPIMLFGFDLKLKLKMVKTKKKTRMRRGSSGNRKKTKTKRVWKRKQKTNSQSFVARNILNITYGIKCLPNSTSTLIEMSEKLRFQKSRIISIASVFRSQQTQNHFHFVRFSLDDLLADVRRNWIIALLRCT